MDSSRKRLAAVWFDVELCTIGIHWYPLVTMWMWPFGSIGFLCFVKNTWGLTWEKELNMQSGAQEPHRWHLWTTRKSCAKPRQEHRLHREGRLETDQKTPFLLKIWKTIHFLKHLRAVWLMMINAFFFWCWIGASNFHFSETTWFQQRLFWKDPAVDALPENERKWEVIVMGFSADGVAFQVPGLVKWPRL